MSLYSSLLVRYCIVARNRFVILRTISSTPLFKLPENGKKELKIREPEFTSWSEEEFRLKEEADRNKLWLDLSINPGEIAMIGPCFRKPVYRFHGIQFYARISRMKITQTIISAVLTAYLGYRYEVGDLNIDESVLFLFTGTTIAAPLVLILFTMYFNRIIGVIAVDPTRTVYRIGHLSFFGGRNNCYARVKDIVPFEEGPSGPQKKLVKLHWHPISAGKYLLLSKRKCEILDNEAAALLFGPNFLEDEKEIG